MPKKRSLDFQIRSLWYYDFKTPEVLQAQLVVSLKSMFFSQFQLMEVMALGVHMESATNLAEVERNCGAEHVINHCHSMVGLTVPFWALIPKLLHVIHMNAHLQIQCQVREKFLHTST